MDPVALGLSCFVAGAIAGVFWAAVWFAITRTEAEIEQAMSEPMDVDPLDGFRRAEGLL